MIFCVPGLQHLEFAEDLLNGISPWSEGHRWTRARAESIGFPRFTMWNHKPVHGAAICTVHTTPDVCIYIYMWRFPYFLKKWGTPKINQVIIRSFIVKQPCWLGGSQKWRNPRISSFSSFLWWKIPLSTSVQCTSDESWWKTQPLFGFLQLVREINSKKNPSFCDKLPEGRCLYKNHAAALVKLVEDSDAVHPPGHPSRIPAMPNQGTSQAGIIFKDQTKINVLSHPKQTSINIYIYIWYIYMIYDIWLYTVTNCILFSKGLVSIWVCRQKYRGLLMLSGSELDK